jgi:hypothetical protein
MPTNLKLPPMAKRGTKMNVGKGWRLLTPSRKRVFKAALLTTFRSIKGKFAVYRIE